MTNDILTISTITFRVKWGDKPNNLKRILGYIEAAGRQGSRMIVFPEMALTGYDDENEKPLTEKMQYKEAETIPGPSTNRIAEAAKQFGVYVLVGMPERDSNDDKKLYNSLAVISPKRSIKTYRKIHLPNPEPNWAKRGDRPLIVQTEWGPIGIAICYDNYCFPELRRYYAAMGCRLVINSTALAKIHGKYRDITLQAGVIQDGVYIVTSNLGGKDLYNYFWGGSSVIGPGQEFGEPFYYAGKKFIAPEADEEKMYTTTIDLSLAHRRLYKYNPKVNGTDWRPDMYIKMFQEAQKHLNEENHE